MNIHGRAAGLDAAAIFKQWTQQNAKREMLIEQIHALMIPGTFNTETAELAEAIAEDQKADTLDVLQDIYEWVYAGLFIEAYEYRCPGSAQVFAALRNTLAIDLLWDEVVKLADICFQTDRPLSAARAMAEIMRHGA